MLSVASGTANSKPSSLHSLLLLHESGFDVCVKVTHVNKDNPREWRPLIEFLNPVAREISVTTWKLKLFFSSLTKFTKVGGKNYMLLRGLNFFSYIFVDLWLYNKLDVCFNSKCQVSLAIIEIFVYVTGYRLQLHYKGQSVTALQGKDTWRHFMVKIQNTLILKVGCKGKGRPITGHE